MVSRTTILKWGPLGGTGWRGWARGGPGLGDRVWGGVWSGVQKCLHSWKVLKAFFLDGTLPPVSQLPGLG